MFEQVNHVAFAVEEIEPAMEQFEATFGLELAGMNSEEHREAHDVIAAFYEAGETVIELMSPTSEAAWVYDHLQEHGEGFFHIAYEVDDLDARMAELEERGVRFTGEPSQGFAGRTVTIREGDTLVPTQLVEVENGG